MMLVWFIIVVIILCVGWIWMFMVMLIMFSICGFLRMCVLRFLLCIRLVRVIRVCLILGFLLFVMRLSILNC